MAALTVRNQRIDAARGVAVIAMVVYHLTWDLAFFGMIDPSTATAPGFRRLGAAIASSFLFISGLALVLARQAVPDDAAFKAKFLRRLAIVAGAAALVSLGTWFAMGDRFVRFGILHCIALSSVIALPFLRAPPWAAFMAGAAFAALSGIVDKSFFAQASLIWLGLSSQTPAMVDYVPVFPFAAMTLFGVAVGLSRRADPPPPDAPAGVEGWLAKLGRWSLPIYLIHQPVLYGALFLIASLTPTSPSRSGDPGVDRDTVSFRTECRRSCETNHGKQHCETYCSCAETSMKTTDLWKKAMSSSDMAPLQAELQPVLDACFAKARDGR